MVDNAPLVFPPRMGIDLLYATDLYQRMFVIIPLFVEQSTIIMQGTVYSAPAGGGGETPLYDATWTLVPGSSTTTFQGSIVKHVHMPQSLFDGLAYIDLNTFVWQHPSKWTQPFEVVHELWGNHYRWNRANPEKEVWLGSTGSKDSEIAPLSREKG